MKNKTHQKFHLKSFCKFEPCRWSSNYWPNEWSLTFEPSNLSNWLSTKSTILCEVSSGGCSTKLSTFFSFWWHSEIWIKSVVGYAIAWTWSSWSSVVRCRVNLLWLYAKRSFRKTTFIFLGALSKQNKQTGNKVKFRVKSV